MTIKPVQSDFINYSRFFKDDYRKGIHRFETMLADPTQYQLLLDSPSALSAVFGPDKVQTPKLCEIIHGLGKVKREAMADKYASLFGHQSHTEMLNAPEVPKWQKRVLFMMTIDKSNLTKDVLIQSAELEAPIREFIGKTFNFGQFNSTELNVYNDFNSFTVIDVLHDELAYEDGMASYTLCTEDGSVMMVRSNDDADVNPWNGSATKYTDGWFNSECRIELNKSTFSDSKFDSLVKTVKKYSTDAYGAGQMSEDKYWILSASELGISSGDISNEGSAYTYLTTRLTRSYEYWTRTRIRNNGNNSISISENGTKTIRPGTAFWGTVICFCI